MAEREVEFDSIVERELEYREPGDETERKARVRIGRPVYVPAEGERAAFWIAPFDITVDGHAPLKMNSYGEDSMQALELALGLIGANLKYRFGGEFRLFGSPELGFPVAGEDRRAPEPADQDDTLEPE